MIAIDIPRCGFCRSIACQNQWHGVSRSTCERLNWRTYGPDHADTIARAPEVIHASRG